MRRIITTRRRLDYARGFLELGLVDEASDELEAIDGAARLSFEVLEVRVDLYTQAKQWDMVTYLARAVCEAKPKAAAVWIAWARALRELQRFAEARDVLLKAEPHHGATSPDLHYDLARYYCLLGDFGEARRRLVIARQMAPTLMTKACEESDLTALWR